MNRFHLGSCFALLSLAFGSTLQAAPKSLNTGIYVNSEGSPLVELLDQAKKTLDLEIYEMDDTNVLAAIRRAMRRDVRVRIIKEPNPVGATCKVFGNSQARVFQLGVLAANTAANNCADQQNLVDEVNSSGGAFLPFQKPELCGTDGSKNCLEHGKVVITDSAMALVSSGNFNATNLCDMDDSPKTCNRDYSYLSQDSDVVSTLEKVFEKDVIGKTYDVGALISAKAAEKVTIGPLSLDPLVSFIQTAKTRLQIENQYLKEPTLNAAIIKAANRGVQVQVTVASACSFGKPKPTEIKKVTAIYQAFDKAGVQSRMFNKRILINGEPGYLHSKAIVVDQKTAWMGSVNGSTQAATQNREYGVFFSDAGEVRKLSAIMDADFSDPNEETWQESLNCAENG